MRVPSNGSWMTGAGDSGIAVNIRVGLNSGEVVVRAIANDLRMDYSAIGQTVHLAARMEQNTQPGQNRIRPASVDHAPQPEQRASVLLARLSHPRAHILSLSGGRDLPTRENERFSDPRTAARGDR